MCIWSNPAHLELSKASQPWRQRIRPARHLPAWGIAWLMAFGLLSPALGLADSPAEMQVRSVHGSFQEVRERLESAIASQGFILSNTLHLQEMLQRTAKDLNMPDYTYLHAEAVEFCSAKLAHLMSQADPRNLANCPFVITLYVLPNQPTYVQVAYRPPVLTGSQAPAVGKIIQETFAAILSELEL